MTKNTILPLMIICTLGALGFISSTKDNYQSLSEGVYTCFARVNQTYTAKLLGQGSSPYLGEDFSKLTQECFAESIQLSKSLKIFDSLKLNQTLNSLASETHWLYQNLRGTSSTAMKLGQGDSSISLNNRYTELEKMKDKALDFIDSEISSLSTYQNLLLGMALLMMGGLFFLIYRSRTQGPVASKDKPNLEEDIPAFNPLYSPFKSKADLLMGETEAVVNEDSVDEALPTLNVIDLLSKVYHYVGTEMQDKNIQVNIEQKDFAYFVNAKPDNLEHIFFNAFVCIMKSSQGTHAHPIDVKIENKMLGEKLSLRMMVDKTFQEGESKDSSRDFSIIKELAQDEGIQFIFEENTNQLLFAFIFEFATFRHLDQSRKLSLVKKGKKKDLVREFQN